MLCRLAGASLLLAASACAAPFINEIHAENVGIILKSDGLTTGVVDVNGSSGDWIEIRNPDGVVNLNGWALSDDPADLGKWVFPSTNIAAGGYLNVFASGKNRAVSGIQLHTNFKLSNSGVVLLSQPDGGGGWTMVHQIGTSENPYPGQKQRFSYGYPLLTGPGGTPGYMETQTPGGVNNATAVNAFAGDTSASVDRGFYTTPQSVTLTTTTPGATLIYTTNGSEPTTINGTQVPPANAVTPPTVALNITTTTIVRVRAIKASLGSSNVDTHSYIFPSAVLQQSAATVTLPFAGWGHDKGDANTAQSDLADADWEMDPRVVNNANPEDQVIASDLLQIPTVSVVMKWDELFGAGGIYISGEGVDKLASFELLNPGGDPLNPNAQQGRQQMGKMHIFGGSSTSRWKSDKLSMNFKFWTDFSTDALGDSAIGTYDKLILDARLNQVWNHSQDATQRNRGDFVRDAVMGDLQNAIGSYAPHSQSVHVYLNGLYWGIYTLHEKPEEHFAASYFGGDSDDYDVVKHATNDPNYLVAGNIINPAVAMSNTNHTAGVNYQALLTLAAADLSVQVNYDAVAEKLDIDDFIQYMLVNFYGGNEDWAQHNWYASYNRVDPNGKWRFHSWDAEHVFKSNNVDVTGKDEFGTGGPTGIHQRLRLNAEYKVKFGDAAHKLLFNGGLFTPTKGKEIFDARLMDINEAVRAESARWGDSGPSTSIVSPQPELHLRFSNFTGGYISWWNERLRILNTILDGPSNRTVSLIAQLRTRTLYPTFDAPVFSQHGGGVPANYALAMTNPGGVGTIYYTLDGSDPRVALTGAISPSAVAYAGAVPLTISKTVKARVRNGVNWSALNEAAFSVGTSPAAAGNVVISKIHYRPAVPSVDEELAGFDSRSDFEFIEVFNTSANVVDLAGVSFSSGLDVSLITDGVRELAPGGRALFVANLDAFVMRHGSELPIAGIFTLDSNLSNSGETLTLVAANNSPIESVAYSNAPPWSPLADGEGPSLVLIRPGTTNANLGYNWRASTTPDGAPGMDDRLLYNTWRDQHFIESDPRGEPMEDADGDGIVNLLELGLGKDPNGWDPASVLPTAQYRTLNLGAGGQPFLTFTYRYVKAAEELVWTAQTANDPAGTWSSESADIVMVGLPEDNEDGTETRTYRAKLPAESDPVRFFRAKVVK